MTKFSKIYRAHFDFSYVVQIWRAENQSGLTLKSSIYTYPLKKRLKRVSGATGDLKFSKFGPRAHMVMECIVLLHFCAFQAISSTEFWVSPLWFWAKMNNCYDVTEVKVPINAHVHYYLQLVMKSQHFNMAQLHFLIILCGDLLPTSLVIQDTYSMDHHQLPA